MLWPPLYSPPASPSPAPPSSFSLCLTLLSHQKLSKSSSEGVVIFRHDPDPAVYDALLSFNSASTTPPVEFTICGLARLDAWIASVTCLLCEKDCRGNRRQKKYSDAFGNFLRPATTQLVAVVRQLAEYQHPDAIEVDTNSIFLKLRKSSSLTRSAALHALFLFLCSPRRIQL